MRTKIWILFAFIFVMVILASIIVWPSGPDLKIGDWYKEIKIHRGLDLQGGAHLVYELDLTEVDNADQDQAAQSVIDVIERRVNTLGLSEPLIQSTNIENKPSVIVELPGVSNINEAISLIGKTAQLSFWESGEIQQEQDQQFLGWQPTQLSGAHLRRADVAYDPNTNDPHVAIEFNNEGKDLFAQLTEKNIGKPLAMVLDNEIISAPTVQAKIPDGKAIITGQFTVTDAKNLAKLLNAGALPVPIKIIEQRNIEASLGEESVKQSLFAALLGLFLLGIFMIIYYRATGVVAVISLLIYAIIVLALFKLIPITLTLAGMAGFILSIGIAVDANVLIFERIKEELREEKTIGTSIEEGFNRAWSSIRDSNISTLITCIILYYTTTGMVRGFAITLAIGVLVSMFSAITVTRNILRILSTTKLAKIIKWGNV